MRVPTTRFEPRRLVTALLLLAGFGLMSLAAAPLRAQNLGGAVGGEVPRRSGGSRMVHPQIEGPMMAAPAPRAPVSPDPTAPDPDPKAPPLGTTIEGINFDQDATNNGSYSIPPDPHGAVGPGHVVSVTNTSIRWNTKGGTLQKSVRLGRNRNGSITGAFFESLNPANATFDPKVIYDQYAGRFLVVTLEMVDNNTTTGNTSRILLAASNSSDPNGTWTFLAINSKVVTTDGVERWTDYPGFAVDSQAVYITGNLFGFNANGGTFGGERLFIVNKASLYAGTGTFTVNNPTAGGGSPTTLQPAQVFGMTSGTVGTFLLGYGGLSNGTQEFVQTVRIDNPLTSPTFTVQQLNIGDIDNTSVSNFPLAPQLGTTVKIDGGDRRIINAVWRDGFLYGAAAVVPGTGADAGQVTAHWFKLVAPTTGAVSLADQGNVGAEDIAAGTYTYYPSVAVNSFGAMAVAFSASSPTTYAGAYYTGRKQADAAGTTQSTGVLAAGQDYYVRTFDPTYGAGENRWGDYTAVSVDPSDNSTFWTFNQYALTRGTTFGSGEDGRWGTRFGSFTLSVTQTGSSSYVVNTTDDHNDGVCTDTDCSLREAMTAAAASSTDDVITFSVTGTIRLTATLGTLPAIPSSATAGALSINNTQAGTVTVNGDVNSNGSDLGDVRLLFVNAGARVTLNNLILTGGRADVSGGGTTANSGGAILNLGTLNLTNCTISNSAAQFGGGISSAGALTVASTTTLSGNTAINGGSGSGLYLSSGTGTVNGSIASNNTVVVVSGATLAGTGNIGGTVSLASGATHAPGNSGPGIQSTGGYVNNGTLSVDITGTTVGSGYDQVNVTGDVTLGGTLNVTIAANYTPVVGDKFTIINNDGSDAITVVSGGLAEGSLINSSDGRTTFFVSYKGADGTGNDLVLTAASTQSVPVLISQFRFSGPGLLGNGSDSALDEFIEVANITTASLNVSGWSVVSSGGVTIPLSGSIPAKGRLLLTNSGGYSLSAYATGDITYTGDIPVGATLSLRNAVPAEVDAVGNLSLIASPTSPTSNYAYLRRLDGGAPRDSDMDTSDFTLVDVGSTGGGTATGLSTLSMGVRLGAPGPHNLSSPIQRNALIASTPLNPGAGFNPVARYGSRGNTSVDTQGRLSLRRNIKNNTGATVTRMRFRLVALTSGTSTSGVSDLRAISSAGVMFNGSQVAQGVTLEAPSTPTASPLPTSGTGNGGGLNSSWTVVLPTGGLLTGNSIGVEFLFGIQTEGSYRIVIDTELLP